MFWTIQGDSERQNPEGYDGHVWQWQLLADHDADERRFIVVRVSGTVMAMGEAALSTRIAVARETRGRSEIEMVVDWPEPPSEIEVLSHGIRPAGGDPGPEQREINEIIEWFEERDAMVIFGAHGMRLEKHSAHVMEQTKGDHLYSVVGLSRLEAIRTAKERWDAEGHGQQNKLEPSAAPTTKQALSIDQEAVKTLRSEGFRIVWTEPTDPDDPIWMGQAFDETGELLEMALGKDPEDVLLELAEALLPKRGRS